MNDEVKTIKAILAETETPAGKTESIKRFSALKKTLKNKGVITELNDLTYNKYIEGLKKRLEEIDDKH